jgi:hypothetical protein
MGHRKIARAFRTLFHDLHLAENAKLRRDGRIAARGLLQDNTREVRIALSGMFTTCREMA